MKQYNHDIIIIAETFIEDRQITVIKQKLQETHEWIHTAAARDRKRGRAMGWIIVGTSKKCNVGKTWLIPELNVIPTEVKILEEWHTIIGVYNKIGIQSMRPQLDKIITHRPDRVIVIGDWNARTGHKEIAKVAQEQLGI